MNKYAFRPYNPKYPTLYEMEKERILSCSTNICDVEHIGSSAIRGVGGKGIIDILLGVDKSVIEDLTKDLQKMGYVLRKEYCTAERLYFKYSAEDPSGCLQMYQLHLTVKNSSEYQALVFFREYLRNHPKEAKEYEEIKKISSVREEYQKNKAPFIERILKKRKKV
ncbi:MAG: hypothetical protein S4CHLAM37_08700 [Chlamydiia bacterium]|nr:hypothetical protein [Chlamydiia bacterium]